MANGIYLPNAQLPNQPRPVTSTPTQYNTTNQAGFGVASNNFSPQGQLKGGYYQTPGTAPVPGVTPQGTTWSVDPTGQATPYTPKFNTSDGSTQWTAGTPTDLFALSQDRILGLIRALRGEGGGPVAMGREAPLQQVPREVLSTMNDRTAAESAAYGAAKDRVAKQSRSALDALRDRASAAGMGGSTAEARGMADIANAAQGELGAVIRQQAADRLGRADALDDRNASLSVAQRAQDIGQEATRLSGDIQQRGQDYQGATNNPMQQLIMQLVSSMGSSLIPRYY